MFLRIALCSVMTIMLIAGESPAAYAGIGEVGGIGQTGALSPRTPEEQPEEDVGSEDATAPLGRKKPAQAKRKAAEEAVEEAPEEDSRAQPTGQSRTVPLLTITYKQKPIYYEKFLKQVITKSEKTKGTTYQLISYVPTAVTRIRDGARYTALFEENLRSIVQQIQALGVSADRIKTSTAYQDGIPTQEINIFAKQPQ